MRVFETPRPKSGHKFAAIKSLLEQGVPEPGIAVLIERAPWDPENKAKWHAQLRKIVAKTAVCPFCRSTEPENCCPVAVYLADPEARRSLEQVIALG